MRTFIVDSNIITCTTAKRVPKSRLHFASKRELAKQTARWPALRFVEVWNAFAGKFPFDNLKPVRRFSDRKTAIDRIWLAIQRLKPTTARRAATRTPKKPMPQKAARGGFDPRRATEQQLRAKAKEIALATRSDQDLLRTPDSDPDVEAVIQMDLASDDAYFEEYVYWLMTTMKRAGL